MSTNHPEVVVIGNAGIDTNVYPSGDAIDWTVEANFTENLDYVGQAGGYATRGYVALGRPTAFIGHVGDDMGGRLIRATFAAEGIDTRAVWVDPRGTQRSVNIMFRDGRRKNFYDGKGHMEMQPDLERCTAALAGARLAHFNIPNWARLLLPLARAQGLTIACDLQDIVALDDPYRADFLAAADIIFCSAVNHRPADLIHALLERRPDLLVVVGMGAEGCGVGSAAGLHFFPAPPLASPIIDTNGAGDALAVGFLTSYVLEGRPIAAAALRGQIAARHTCALRATSAGMISATQLDDIVARIE